MNKKKIKNRKCVRWVSDVICLLLKKLNSNDIFFHFYLRIPWLSFLEFHSLSDCRRNLPSDVGFWQCLRWRGSGWQQCVQRSVRPLLAEGSWHRRHPAPLWHNAPCEGPVPEMLNSSQTPESVAEKQQLNKQWINNQRLMDHCTFWLQKCFMLEPNRNCCSSPLAWWVSCHLVSRLNPLYSSSICLNKNKRKYHLNGQFKYQIYARKRTSFVCVLCRAKLTKKYQNFKSRQT